MARTSPRGRPIRLALAAPIDRPLTYLAPDPIPPVGVRVEAPLRGRPTVGFVLGPEESPPAGVKLARIGRVLDDAPLFPPTMIPFFEWLAGYYRHPLGQVMAAAAPVGRRPKSIRPRPVKSARAIPVPEAAPPELPPVQAKLFTYLTGKDWVPLAVLRQLNPGADRTIKALEGKGLVETARLEPLDPGPVEAAEPEESPYDPTPDQAAVLTAVEPAVTAGKFASFLIHGVTGSGKTEVYLRAGRAALEAGRTAIILVPEIALTPALMARFRSRFGDRAALLHSALADSARLREWRRLLEGTARIAVGPRSALFAPVRNLGLIVVDEEHEPSYKQEDRLRYHARDAALVRCQMEQAVCLLGSATPSLVSYHHQAKGKYTGLSMPRRVNARPMPRVDLIDLTEHQEAAGKAVVFSRPLIEAMEQNLAAGGQTLLFLNRRGYATYPVCAKCGRPILCPNCSVSFTYHQAYDAFVCHYCGQALDGESSCPKCGHDKTKRFGLGTERVEAEVRELFPQARTARLDSDTAGNGRAMEAALAALEAGETDIMVGTQMLAKGHDFPGISLVGVVLADSSLFMADFRAAERTFQLLTQVAGRAGRGDAPGRVLVQTLSPDHFALTSAANHDFKAFYEQELAGREMLFYPPYSRLILLRLSGADPAKVDRAARDLAALCREEVGRGPKNIKAVVLGPAPAAVAKVRNRYRWRILLKVRTAALGQALLDRILPRTEDRPALAGIRLDVDVDPMNML